MTRISAAGSQKMFILLVINSINIFSKNKELQKPRLPPWVQRSCQINTGVFQHFGSESISLPKQPHIFFVRFLGLWSKSSTIMESGEWEA